MRRRLDIRHLTLGKQGLRVVTAPLLFAKFAIRPGIPSYPSIQPAIMHFIFHFPFPNQTKPSHPTNQRARRRFRSAFIIGAKKCKEKQAFLVLTRQHRQTHRDREIEREREREREKTETKHLVPFSSNPRFSLAIYFLFTSLFLIFLVNFLFSLFSLADNRLEKPEGRDTKGQVGSFYVQVWIFSPLPSMASLRSSCRGRLFFHLWAVCWLRSK